MIRGCYTTHVQVTLLPGKWDGRQVGMGARDGRQVNLLAKFTAKGDHVNDEQQITAMSGLPVFISGRASAVTRMELSILITAGTGHTLAEVSTMNHS